LSDAATMPMGWTRAIDFWLGHGTGALRNWRKVSGFSALMTFPSAETSVVIATFWSDISLP